MVGLSTLDFQQFPYVPLLSARVAEVQGYRELQTSDKRRLLPTFRIERYGNGIDLNVSIRRVVIAAEGRPFILDLDRTPGRPSVSRSKPEYAEQVHKAATYNSYLTNLSAPANGFANWRAMCLSAPNAIPCALLCGPTAEFERQVREMHAQVGKVAVRVRPADPNVDLLFDFFSGFGAARDILVIVDLEDVSGRANAAARDFEVVRNSIRKRLSRGFFQNLNIVCAGTRPC